jgi:hypothetical protein
MARARNGRVSCSGRGSQSRADGWWCKAAGQREASDGATGEVKKVLTAEAEDRQMWGKSNGNGVERSVDRNN